MPSTDWEKGFKAGWSSAMDDYGPHPEDADEREEQDSYRGRLAMFKPKAAKKKRKQTGKAKVLTDMTRPIWNKYKKGSGKKTYFDIRSQVQRSQKYKKATKKM